MPKVGKILNKTFGHVYIKNLKQSVQRRELIEKSFQEVELNYTVVPAYTGKKFVNDDFSFQHGWFNITYPSSAGFFGGQITTMKIIMDEIEKQSDSYIACDDDCFIRNISFLSEKVLETISSNLPEQWDIIILGGLRYDGNIQNLSEFTYQRCIHGHEAAGSHALAINKNIYKSFFQEFISLQKWGDGCIDSLITKGANVYSLYPSLVFQDRSLFSDINEKYNNDFIIPRSV